MPINTIEHETFQENISNYLQGNPDDVWTWFAGYRMQFFAERGLAGDISAVWENLTGFTDAFKNASTSSDGKQYFVPQSYYPWAVFFRKSVWEENGYEVPTTFDEMNTLAATMQDDGLIPFAFADKDGWPAMGTFDILNMRINGYDFHVSLMAGEESWESDQVKDVFDTWRGILPLHQPDSLGPDVAGGRPGARRQGGGDVPARHVRVRAVPRGGASRTSTSSTTPSSTPTSARVRSTRRSTG